LISGDLVVLRRGEGSVDKMEGVGWEFGGVVRSYPRGSRVILCLAVGDVKGAIPVAVVSQIVFN